MRVRTLILIAAAIAALTLSAAGTAAAKARTVTVPLKNADRCEFIASPQNGRCLLPFPSNWYTLPEVDDEVFVNFKAASMPANKQGKRIDPREWNRQDGFSPGQQVTVKVPGLDTPAAFRRTAPVPITDMRQYAKRTAPVVAINTRTGKRHLIWAELDSTAKSVANTALIIRPGTNWEEGTRYVIALRSLRNAAGRTLAAPPAFRAYRDKLKTRQAIVERRRPAMERIFRDLKRAGIARGDLYLAWDFTIASEQGLSERMLGIRDNAFAQLGDRNLADRRVAGRAPTFTVDPVTTTFNEKNGTWNYLPCGADGCQAGEDNEVFKRITGTVTVPCYLNKRGCPAGASFSYRRAGDKVPAQMTGNTYAARFTCKIPRASLDGPARANSRPSIYGHGLLGDVFGEINQDQIADMTFEHGFVYCGTNEIGMASEDVPNAVKILRDLSSFKTLADRVQQGMLNELYLSRAMIHPQGFGAHSEFRPNGPAILAGSRGYYDGNSQGGIIGGALAAVAPDFDRAVLGVPGMNYSTLLQRSVDFNSYAVILYDAYPDTLDRQIYLSLIQMLWDRAEANGYAHHMTTDSYRNTPPHEVMLQVGWGDHQVTDYAARVEARTIGAGLYSPSLTAGRTLDRDPFYAIRPITRYPARGSALVIFDSGPLRDAGKLGTPPSPITNVPNSVGNDPHELPRRTVQGRAMKSAFLSPGSQIIKGCGAKPCYSGGWTGP